MTNLAKAEATRNAVNPKKPRRRIRATPPCKDLEPPPGGWRTPNADKDAADVAAANVAYDKANNPFYHAKRFEIQVHKNGERQNLYFPTWQLVAIVLSTKQFDAADPHRPDRVIVSDNRDTYSRVLEFEKCWYGYETRLCRGAARGEEPRGFEGL